MAKKKTSQQPAPVKDKPQAPAQDQARTAAPARVTTVSLTTCLVSVVVALALGLCIGSMLPDGVLIFFTVRIFRNLAVRKKIKHVLIGHVALNSFDDFF